MSNEAWNVYILSILRVSFLRLYNVYPWAQFILCFCMVLCRAGKTPFGLPLPFRLTLPAWGQYFRLLLNFHLQVLQNFCLHLNFCLPQNFCLTDFWYDTELSSTENLIWNYNSKSEIGKIEKFWPLGYKQTWVIVNLENSGY